MRAARWLVYIILLAGLTGTILSDLDVYPRLLYFGLTILIGARIWAWASLAQLGILREARSLRASVGDVFDERFELINRGWLPRLWIEVINQSPIPYVTGSRLVTGVRAWQRYFYTSRSWLFRRGAFPLGPTKLISGDPFGLFQSSREFPARDTLVVLPYMAEITSFPLPAGLITGGRVISRKALDVTPHASGVREYVPGDPMKRIHWPSTARRRQLIVKEFDQDPQTQVWLFLDAQKDVQAALGEEERPGRPEDWMFGKRPDIKLPPSTFEYAVSITASLAHYYLRRRLAVGFAAVGQQQTIIPADRSERQEDKILESLAFIEPRGDLPIYALVNAQAGLLPRGSSVVLITPTVRTEFISAIDNLQRRDLYPIVVLLMTKSFGGWVGSEDLSATLEERSIPLCKIYQGADIGISLNDFSREKGTQEFEEWLKRPSIHWI